MSKVLVAYFSHSGKTRKVANMIASKLQADCFEIETIREYPDDESQCIEVARVEYNGNVRPALRGGLPDMDQYDTLVIGFPNWHDTCPMAVLTFLEGYDITGKTVYPFVTHEGSGPDGSNENMQKACKGADVKPARDGNRLEAKDVKSWIA